MDIDSAIGVVKEEHLPVEETDDSCTLEYFEIVPLARDADGSCAINDIKEEPLQVEETDDSCRLKLTDVVSLARDTDGCCTTECVSGDWSAEVKQENLAVVKQEPGDVCCIFRPPHRICYAYTVYATHIRCGLLLLTFPWSVCRSVCRSVCLE